MIEKNIFILLNAFWILVTVYIILFVYHNYDTIINTCNLLNIIDVSVFGGSHSFTDVYLTTSRILFLFMFATVGLLLINILNYMYED